MNLVIKLITNQTCWVCRGNVLNVLGVFWAYIEGMFGVYREYVGVF